MCIPVEDLYADHIPNDEIYDQNSKVPSYYDDDPPSYVFDLPPYIYPKSKSKIITFFKKLFKINSIHS